MNVCLLADPACMQVTARINEWMLNAGPFRRHIARVQWLRVLSAVSHHAPVFQAGAADGCQDLVFAANWATVVGRKAVMSRMKDQIRRLEYSFARAALEANQMEVIDLPSDIAYHEGQAEAHWDRSRKQLICFHGFRSTEDSPDALGGIFGVGTLKLRLVSPWFYHGDTAMFVLPNLDGPSSESTLAYHPDAFDSDSMRRIDDAVSSSRYRIEIDERDARAFGANTIVLGNQCIMSADISDSLERQVRDRGYDVRRVRTTELRKSGGGAKCCVLVLDFSDG